MQANYGNLITLVYSASGGVGRTTVALGLCAHFARMGQKVLYLNLDWAGIEAAPADTGHGAGFGTTRGAAAGAGRGLERGSERGSERGPEYGAGMTDIIFSIKSRPQKLGLRLEALRRTDSCGKFDYYAPPDYPTDIDELEPAELELLIGKFRSMRIYDRIVIDTHSGLSVRNRALIELSDSIVVVSESDRLSLKKLAAAKSQIDRCFMDFAPALYKRCQFVINKAGWGEIAARQRSYSGETAALAAQGRQCREGGAEYQGGSCSPDAAPHRESAEEVSRLFGANAYVLPYCADIFGSYAPDALTDRTGGFGAAIAEVASALEKMR
jgi:hypothetical protein